MSSPSPSPSSSDDNGCYRCVARQWRGHVIMTFCALLHAIWYVLAKLVLNTGVNPIVFVLYREFLTGVLLFTAGCILAKPSSTPLIVPQGASPAQRRASRQTLTWLQSRDFGRFFVSGFLMSANQMLTILGIKYTSVSVFGLFAPMIPVWTVLVCVILGIERMTWMKGVGVVSAVAGALVIVVFAGEDSTSGTTLGGVLALLAQSIAAGVWHVWQRPTALRYNALWHTFWMYFFAIMFTALVACYWITADVWTLRGGGTMEWLVLAYAVCFTSFLAYSLASYSQKYLPASVISLYLCVAGMMAVILAAIFFSTVVTTPQWIGATLIVIGLGLVMWARERLRDDVDARRQRDKKRENAPYDPDAVDYGDEDLLDDEVDAENDARRDAAAAGGSAGAAAAASAEAKDREPLLNERESAA